MSLKTTGCNAAQNAIGHTFGNTALLLEALDTTGMRTNESNQRLAMLGDALLKMILLDGWYAGSAPKGLHGAVYRSTHSRSQHTGQGNNLVSTTGSNANLAVGALDAGIDQHVILHPGHIGKVSDKTLATTVEAILGAVYLDTAKDVDAVSRTMALLGLNI